MRDVLAELAQWWRDGQPVGMATVVGTWRSAPRPAGATMLVGADGTAVGSVSGGCVEGAVYELCQQAIETGVGHLQRYGISDDDAFEVGLTCGGIIDLLIERVDRTSFPELGDVAASVDAGEPVADRHLHRGSGRPAGPAAGGLARPAVGEPRAASGSTTPSPTTAGACSPAGRTGIVHYGHDGERRGDELALFVASYAPRPRMLVFGAIDFATAVARVGVFLGYQVTVCDARPVFATPKRFPDADEVIVDWPHRYLQGEVDAGRVDGRTVVCVLTHDPKFDVPVLRGGA